MAGASSQGSPGGRFPNSEQSRASESSQPTRINRFDSRLRALPWWILSTGLLVVALLKGGFGVEVAAQNPDPSFPLPEPGAVDSLSFGLPALVWLLGIQGQTSTIAIVTFALILIGYFSSAYLLVRTFDGLARTVALILLGLGPTITVLLGNIGRHDLLVVFGAVLVGLRGYKWSGVIIGSALMFLGNPEQTLVALTSLALLSLTPNFSQYRARVLTLGVSSLGLFLILREWAEGLGADSRAGWFGYHLQSSLLNFFGSAYLVLFSGYAILWILVVWRVINSRGRARLLYVLSLIAVPTLATITTMDQTRVFIGVSTATLFALVRVDLERLTDQIRRLTPHAASWTLAVFFATPVLDITYRAYQRIPFRWVYDAFANAGFVERIGIGPW